jgi:YggT family protein
MALFITFLQQALILIIIIYTVLSFVMSPYHPVRVALARVIEPMLEPIRRLVPPISGLDLSPLVLIILVQLFGMILKALLSTS